VGRDRETGAASLVTIRYFFQETISMKCTKPSPSWITFAVVLILAMNISAFAASGTWSPAGSVRTARDGHTGTLLPNGNLVIAGGENNNQALASTEVYSQGSWKYSGNLNVARSNASAILLPNGTILVAGGCTGNCLSSATASAEIYNPVSGTWSKTGSMSKTRTYFGMVLLPSGSVMAVGGCTGLNANGCSGVTSSSEIYNPSTGKWSSTGAMNAARGSLTATVLPNGKVLAAGGINGADNPIPSAELYDPATGKWTATGKMNVARDEHTAVLLATGNVLVAGGENLSGVSTVKAELYNPSTGKWTLTGSMHTSRLEHTMTLLMNGNVLVAGGTRQTLSGQSVLASAEIYDPGTGIWSVTGSLQQARTGHTATLLPSGYVIAVSGSGQVDDVASCEMYTP
jgi:N-acetylneuraminic acid mutarotase